MSALKARITDDMKAAMRAGEKDRLGVIRLVLAALKQREVDERIELDDTQVLAVLEKMVKQRRDSIEQFTAASREDLAAVERAEVTVIEAYLPAALGEAEIDLIVATAISETGAAGPRDMGKVVAQVKPQVLGRADMGKVSELIKRKLAG
ncbi:GatB/YqeY domain-containing protein [Dokdonella sp. MW10]|uniref:GatB/YqeY domain-containing protein n=1 Tax=Dokdonella sp. MW10 TaxID=2992926 RepID=UPI003F7FECDF